MIYTVVLAGCYGATVLDKRRKISPVEYEQSDVQYIDRSRKVTPTITAVSVGAVWSNAEGKMGPEKSMDKFCLLSFGKWSASKSTRSGHNRKQLCRRDDERSRIETSASRFSTSVKTTWNFSSAPVHSCSSRGSRKPYIFPRSTYTEFPRDSRNFLGGIKRSMVFREFEISTASSFE